MSEHILTLGQSLLIDCVIPECSCGWEGDVFNTVPAAVDAWENHCDVVFMEATTSETDQ